jgi:hypothetical protein
MAGQTIEELHLFFGCANYTGFFAEAQILALIAP